MTLKEVVDCFADLKPVEVPPDLWPKAAAIWADWAAPEELEAYTLAGLAKIGESTLAVPMRKRIFAALWDSFTDADRIAFARAISLTRAVA